jgi:hypothetical protein
MTQTNFEVNWVYRLFRLAIAALFMKSYLDIRNREKSTGNKGLKPCGNCESRRISFIEKKMMYQSYFMPIVPVSKGDEITKKLYPLRAATRSFTYFYLMIRKP